jgi:hypothetical protein
MTEPTAVELPTEPQADIKTLQTDYNIACAEIGDRKFKIMLLEREIQDLHTKQLKINKIVGDLKSAELKQVATQALPEDGVA